MNLTFSTVCCPEWSLEEILLAARKLGFKGIEIRGLTGRQYIPDLKDFSEVRITDTMIMLASSGVKLDILTSNACIGLEKGLEKNILCAKAYINLAEKLKVPYVGVIISPEPGICEGDVNLCQDVYSELCDYALPKNVSVLIETSGILGSSGIMADLIERTYKPNSGVLWDVHHPYRYFGEKPYDTVRNLLSLVKHVHVKDSVCVEGEVKYRMLGYGDVPVMDCLKALDLVGYTKSVSLEFARNRQPESFDIQSILKHYIDYMNCMEKLF